MKTNNLSHFISTLRTLGDVWKTVSDMAVVLECAEALHAQDEIAAEQYAYLEEVCWHSLFL